MEENGEEVGFHAGVRNVYQRDLLRRARRSEGSLIRKEFVLLLIRRFVNPKRISIIIIPNVR